MLIPPSPVHQCVIPDVLPPSLVEAAKELLAAHRETHTVSWHGPPVDTSTDARAEITDEERRLIPRAGDYRCARLPPPIVCARARARARL